MSIVFDLSEYQPDDRVQELLSENPEGFILKLGETISGTPSLDPKFVQFVNEITAAGLPYGIYYVCHAHD